MDLLKPMQSALAELNRTIPNTDCQYKIKNYQQIRDDKGYCGLFSHKYSGTEETAFEVANKRYTYKFNSCIFDGQKSNGTVSIGLYFSDISPRPGNRLRLPTTPKALYNCLKICQSPVTPTLSHDEGDGIIVLGVDACIPVSSISGANLKIVFFELSQAAGLLMDRIQHDKGDDYWEFDL